MFFGCFSWMIPNLYIKNCCFTKHPLKTGCLEFQVPYVCPKNTLLGLKVPSFFVAHVVKNPYLEDRAPGRTDTWLTMVIVGTSPKDRVVGRRKKWLINGGWIRSPRIQVLGAHPPSMDCFRDRRLGSALV